MTTCPECGDWIFVYQEHKCLLAWQVCIPSFHGEDCWEWVFALNEEAAALKMAEDYDSGEYALLNGCEITVFVWKDLPDKGIKGIKKFICSGELTPLYTAVEIEMEEKDVGANDYSPVQEEKGNFTTPIYTQRP